MTTKGTTKLIILRHAPALSEGRIAGRRDVGADCSDALGFDAMRNAIGTVDHILVSPARRCQETLAHLWPEANGKVDVRLWEQDFGDWEGHEYRDLPDLGALGVGELAVSRPPRGESFLDMAERCTPALLEAANLEGIVAVIAHAGVVRVALSLALGAMPLGLTFQVAPLSMTKIFALPKSAWSIESVNWTPR